jgi:4-amino-4-deoxy-L-arabinose transferase-like glycosyltransferase
VLVYWLGAPTPWRRRLVDVTLAAIVVVAVSLPWAVVYDLTPADRRPFAGSSRENSMLELAVGHNGVGRFVRRAAAPRLDAAGARAMASPPAVPVTTPAEVARRSAWLELFVRAPVGALRLADGRLAGQAGWLFPLAAIGLVTGAGLDRWRRPLAPARLGLILWGGWALTYGVVYSYAGGIFHFYYLATMAPPLAALAAVGVVALWGLYLHGGWRAACLPVALVLTAAWQMYVEWSALGWTLDGSPGPMAVLVGAVEQLDRWRAWLHRALLGGTLAAALALLVLVRRRAWSGPGRALAASVCAVGLVALLLIPAAWALSSVLVAGNAVLPSANLSRLSVVDGNAEARAQLAAAGSIDTTRLVGFLAANRQGERYLLATSSTRLAAPIIIGTGDAVMAMGGFHGLDPILTPEKLARMVEAREVRFVMLGDLSLVSRRMGGLTAGRPVADWVRANGTLVDPALWRASVPAAPAAEQRRARRDAGEVEPGGASGGVDGPAAPAARAWRGRAGGMQLYDLRADLGLVPASSTQ